MQVLMSNFREQDIWLKVFSVVALNHVAQFSDISKVTTLHFNYSFLIYKVLTVVKCVQICYQNSLCRNLIEISICWNQKRKRLYFENEKQTISPFVYLLEKRHNMICLATTRILYMVYYILYLEREIGFHLLTVRIMSNKAFSVVPSVQFSFDAQSNIQRVL